MADLVRQNDEIARRVEKLSRAKEHAAKLLRKKLGSRTARAVKSEHRIAHDTSTVTRRRADCAVMQFQFRRDLAAAKAKVGNHIIAFNGCGISFRRPNLGPHAT